MVTGCFTSDNERLRLKLLSAGSAFAAHPFTGSSSLPSGGSVPKELFNSTIIAIVISGRMSTLKSRTFALFM
jgi:hypothetical protein